MRVLVVFALVIFTDAATIRIDDWEVDQQVKVTSQKVDQLDDLRCHSAGSCADPWVEFFNPTTNHCVAKGGEGFECGYFPEEKHEEACLPSMICHNFEDGKHKFKKSCKKPTQEQCRQCACGQCESKAGIFGSFLQCKTDCAATRAKVTRKDEHCVRVTAEATATVTVHVKKDGLRGTASATKTAQGTATVCEPCGDKAADKATVEAKKEALSLASEKAIAEAEAEAKKKAIAAAKPVVAPKPAEPAVVKPPVPPTPPPAVDKEAPKEKAPEVPPPKFPNVKEMDADVPGKNKQVKAEKQKQKSGCPKKKQSAEECNTGEPGNMDV